MEEMMTEQRPVLDIIAVTYGHTDVLKCFINSIWAQTSRDWRLVIIHDGLNARLCTDLHENGYVDREKVIFVEHPVRTGNYGHMLRTYGLRFLLENEFVLLTNGDNYYVPTMVESVLAHAKDYDFIYFDCVHSHNNPSNHNKSSYGHMDCSLSISKVDMGCVVVRSDLAKGYEFDLRTSADWRYFKKVLSFNPRVIKIDKILFVHN